MTQSYIVSKRATPTVTRISDSGDTNAVGTTFAEAVTINGFRAVVNVTGSGAKFQTLYKIECEL